MNSDNNFASRDDMTEMSKSVGSLANQISILVTELKNDRKSADNRELKHNKDVDSLKLELKEEIRLAAAERKELRASMQKLRERIIPVESISETIKSISTKIIGSLLLMSLAGGIGVFALIKFTGA